MGPILIFPVHSHWSLMMWASNWELPVAGWLSSWTPIESVIGHYLTFKLCYAGTVGTPIYIAGCIPLRLQTLPLGLEPVDFDWNCLHIFQKSMAYTTRTNASGMGMWECHCSAQLGPWRAGWCLECRKGPHQTHEQRSKGSSQTGQTKELYYCILVSPSTTIPTNPSMNANSATTRHHYLDLKMADKPASGRAARLVAPVEGLHWPRYSWGESSLAGLSGSPLCISWEMTGHSKYHGVKYLSHGVNESWSRGGKCNPQEDRLLMRMRMIKIMRRMRRMRKRMRVMKMMRRMTRMRMRVRKGSE